MTVPRLTTKDQKVSGSPIPGNLHFFPQNSWNNPPAHWPMKLSSPWKPTMSYFGAILTVWADPHSVCVMYFSLNKPTSYLSLCLLLNSFWGETLRTWASLSAETRYVISVKRQWLQVPIWVTQYHMDWCLLSLIFLEFFHLVVAS